MAVSSDNVYCYAHIPKCAGNTLLAVLERLFYGSFQCTSHGFGEPFLTPAQIELGFRSLPNLRCLAGHSVTCSLPYSSTHRNVVGIAVVREPTDRLLSEFSYRKMIGMHDARGKTCEEFVAEIASKPDDDYFRNTQTKFMGMPLTQALSLVAAKKLILIPQERLLDGFLLLKHRFPADFHDVSFVAKNVNIDRDRSLRVPSHFIEKCVGQDMALYNAVCSTFNQQVAEELEPDWLQRQRARLINQNRLRRAFKEPLTTAARKFYGLTMRW